MTRPDQPPGYMSQANDLTEVVFPVDFTRRICVDLCFFLADQRNITDLRFRYYGRMRIEVTLDHLTTPCQALFCDTALLFRQWRGQSRHSGHFSLFTGLIPRPYQSRYRTWFTQSDGDKYGLWEGHDASSAPRDIAVG
jgi:hypothetical protein